MIDFLVIGVQKSATSWLYYCLNEHPEIILPERKKEVEYIGGPLYKQKGGISWYYGLFGDKINTVGRKVGDVSVEYFYSEEAPLEIYKYLPDCKFILLLRNPTDRFKSAYFWYLRKGLIDQSVKINAQILKAMASDPDDRCLEIVNDLLNRGYYESQLDSYLAAFNPSQFHVAFFEEINQNPQGALSAIYSFLGVEKYFSPPSIDSKPKQNSYNSFLIFIESLGGKNKIVSKVADRTNQLLARFLKHEVKDKVFDKEITEILNSHYKEVNSGLHAKLTQISGGEKNGNALAKYWNW